MSRESLLVVMGIILAVSPFSGFPLSWLMWFYLLIGLIIAGIAFSLRRARSPQVHEAPPVLS